MSTIVKVTRADDQVFVIAAPENWPLDRDMFVESDGFGFSIGTTDSKDPTFTVKIRKLYVWLAGCYIVKEILITSDSESAVMIAPSIERTLHGNDQYIGLSAADAQFRSNTKDRGYE